MGRHLIPVHAFSQSYQPPVHPLPGGCVFFSPQPSGYALHTLHLSRLSTALHALLHQHRVAALGTRNTDGTPYVSMVPFAINPVAAQLVLHTSGLAMHTHNLASASTVSLMVMEPERAGAPVHALPRVTMQGHASFLTPHDTLWQDARSAYLVRFPEAEPMTHLGDFRFVAVTLSTAHQVAGFGAARSLDAATLAQLLALPAPPAV